MKRKNHFVRANSSKVIPGPLNGVLVIGLCSYLAGPIALQMLVRLGALVVKIERGSSGDPSRKVFSGGVFNSLTYSQMSLAVNMTKESDRTLLRDLMDMADVIVDNRSSRAKLKDQIVKETLEGLGTSKIYCSIDGFPSKNGSSLPGLDAQVQAATGFAYTNQSSSGPLKVGAPILDSTTGLMASTHIIANLLTLMKEEVSSSFPRVVRLAVSLAGVSVWLQFPQYVKALSGEEYFRKGNQDQFAVPFSYYKAKDGYISIATVNEDQFQRFCLNVLGDEDFGKSFATVEYRIENQDIFEEELNVRLLTRSTEYWCKLCRREGIPSSPVLNVTDSMKQSFFSSLKGSSKGGLPIITAGVCNSAYPSIIDRGGAPEDAPSVGEDRASIESALYGVSRM